MEETVFTEFACLSAGLSPEGVPYQGPDIACAFCGRPIRTGDLHIPKTIGDNFMDASALASPGHGTVCGWCAACKSKSFLGRAGGAVFTKDGAYPIMKDDNRAWFLLTPPEPPFIVIMKSISNSQHLVWRAPMTYSTEAIQLRFGPNVLTIRHSVLMKAVAICQELGDAVTTARQEKETGKKKAKEVKPVNHPFAFLSRDLKDPRGAAFVRGALDLAKADPKIDAQLEFLRRLTDGELWALATLCKGTPANPTKPEPIDFFAKK